MPVSCMSIWEHEHVEKAAVWWTTGEAVKWTSCLGKQYVVAV